MPVGYGRSLVQRPRLYGGAAPAAPLSPHAIADEPSAAALMQRSVRPAASMTAAAPGVAPAAAVSAPAAAAAAPAAPPSSLSPYLQHLLGPDALARLHPAAAVPGGPAAEGDSQGYLGDIGAHFPGLQDLARYLIGQGGKEGVFSPHYMRNAIRRRALTNAESQRNRTDVLSRILGLDPNQRATALTDADIAANQGVSGALNEADMADLQQYMGLIQSLFGSERGGEANLFQQREQNRFAKSQQPSFLHQLAGGLVGSIPAFFGGGGGGTSPASNGTSSGYF